MTTEARTDRGTEALERSLRGCLVRPDDPDYDQHRRVWNGSIDRFPALIVRCAAVSDVIAAVRYARETGIRVAVRGGGHSFPGLSVCDGGLVIDLGLMNGIRVDPRTRTARVQAGALLGDVDRATQAVGLVLPVGIVSHTGVAGLTLGGGLGFIMRKFGLTIDNLRRAEVVTADGQVVTASEGADADLFWALRGGGGNFGVVTEFEFDLHRLGPEVVAGPVFWDMDDAPDVLRFYREWTADASDELMTILVQRRAPDLPIVPREVVGRRVVAVVCCYAGPVAAGERVVEPLKRFGRPLLDLCERKPYLTHQQMFDPSFRRGCWYYVKSCDVAELGDEIVDVMTDYGNRITSPLTSVGLWQMGGAVARVGDDETAFHGRGAGFAFNINGNTESAAGFEDEREWARSYWSALSPFHTSVYVNFLMEEGEDRIRQAYGAAKYDRLKALKRRYDPDNVFRLNQNIPPG